MSTRPTHRGARRAPATSERRRIGAGLAALVTLGLVLPPASPATARAAGIEGDVDVVNTETVQIYTDATGAVQSQRVYEQLTATGDGTVDLVNPVETDGLRNLDGFAGVAVADGTQQVRLDVDGVERWRTVSDYDGQAPLAVEVGYRLDGQVVEPQDVVGASGELEVTYRVSNVSAREQEVTFSDGSGGTVTRTAEVPVPMAGSLSITTPSSFSDVRSESFNIAGDGKGGTKLSATMTLFPPIGSDTVEVAYTAYVTDALVPRADISALPLNPFDNPTFANAAESYESGSETGEELAAGATEIDTNLLRLRDGASDLLAGLVQLREGSAELADGLTEDAAPGARRLADGADDLSVGTQALLAGTGQLADGSDRLADGTERLDDGASRLADGADDLLDGTGRLDDGATRVADGASRLSDGADRLADGADRAQTGSAQLADGLLLIRDGLDQLSGVEGLPAAQEGVTRLRDGVDLILSRVGSLSDAESLIGGLAALESGIAGAGSGAGQLRGGLQQLLGDGSATNPGLVAARGGVEQVRAGLDESLRQAANPTEGGSLQQLQLGLNGIKVNFCATHPAPQQCNGLVDQLLAGVATSRTSLTQASAGLGQVSTGLSGAIGGLETQLIPGMTGLVNGLSAAETGAGRLGDGAVELRGGLQQVRRGLTDLSDGITSAVAGSLELADGAGDALDGGNDLAGGLRTLDAGASDLSDGAGDLADGADDLAEGTGTLDAGAGDLADGAGDLAEGAGTLRAGVGDLVVGVGDLDDGAGRLDDGAGRLADGAGELSDGLDAAATGARRLSDGNRQAADGAPELVDGAGRLSSEGMSQLITAGEDTAQDYGRLYAVIEAGAARADAEKMAYGAPEGATGLTAYSFVIEGEDGEGGRNLTRGLGALGIALLGLGAFALRRRLG